MRVVWTEQAWARLLEIEAFVHAMISNTVEALTVFEGHRLLRADELSQGE